MTHPHFVPPNSVPPTPGPPAFVTPPNVAPVVPSPSAPQESVLLEPTSEMPVLGRSNVDAPEEADHGTDTTEPAHTDAHSDAQADVAVDEPAAAETAVDETAVDEPVAETDTDFAATHPADTDLADTDADLASGDIADTDLAATETATGTETDADTGTASEALTDPVAVELAEAAEAVAEAKADIEEAQAELDEAQSDLAEAGEAIEESIEDSASLDDALPEDDSLAETPAELEEVEEPEAYAGAGTDLISESAESDEFGDEEDLYEEEYADGETETVAGLRPGDIEETTIAIWDPEVAERYREAWRDIQAHFVDEPEAALGEAQDLVAEAVQALADALLAEQVSLDPHEDDETPDTEALRMAMRGYRDFLERVLAL